LHAFAHADGSYHLMGVVLSAAAANKWWIEDIIGTTDYFAEEKDIVNLGDNRVFFLPYLMGERSPHNNPDARGVFIGMSMDTTKIDMNQAALEGVIFALRDSLEIAKSLGIRIERTKVCGGGAKSALWLKMTANIMNIKVDVLEHEEGPALGGAMLAAVACGEYADVVAASQKIVKIKETIAPETALVAKYERRYRQYKSIYPALKTVFDSIK
jgi:xylulokinase